MLATYEQHSRRKLIATVLSVIIIAGGVVLIDHLKARHSSAASLSTQITPNKTTSPSATNQTATPAAASNASTNNSNSATTTSAYHDGSYSASSSYYVPNGNESIRVTLTLKDGAIADASIQNSEGDQQSASYQEQFASVYRSYVVGRKISGLRIGIVAGASDTSLGFQDALSQIASKAQA